MKLLGLILLTTTVVSCDPYGFGFKKNPAYVLDVAFTAITNVDVESFLEVTAKEALCIYGNEKGLVYLKDKLAGIDPENVRLVPKVLETRHYTAPVYVGYWAYYNERYEIELRDRGTDKLVLETIVDCAYGTEGEKSEKFVNQRPQRYKKKECRAVKLRPATFVPLPVPPRCGLLRVDL
jgi:hypothetical protein